MNHHIKAALAFCTGRRMAASRAASRQNASSPPNQHDRTSGGWFGNTFVALLVLAGVSTAQAYDPNASNRVRALAAQPDGGMLAAGQFTTIGGVPRSGFARLRADGSVDTTYYIPTIAAGGPIWGAIAVQADGKALVSGAGLLGNGGLLRINTDGTPDTSFVDAISSGNARIETILPLADGRILIGGNFQTVAGQARTNIARLNADGTLDASFDAGSLLSLAPVDDIAVQADGRIVVAGYARLVRLQASGQADTAAPLAALSGSPAVREVQIQENGGILVGSGDSLAFGDGVNRGTLVRLNADGSVDTAFAPAVDFAIDALVVNPADGKILIGGAFATVGGQSRPGLARLNADGSLDAGFGDLLFNSVQVYAIATQPDGKLVIGGSFTNLNGLVRNRIARLHPDGRVDNGATASWTVTPRSGANGSISPATPQSVDEGGKAVFTITPEPGYAVATITGCGGTRSGNLYTTSWIFSNCEVVASFVPESQVIFNPEANGNVESLAVQPDGRILAAGWFTSIGRLPKIKFARLSPADGSADPDFADGTGIYDSSNAYVVAVQADGKTLIGGQEGILRINADGTLDDGFHTDLAGEFPSIVAIAPHPDGKIFIGGFFSSVGGVARTNIARLQADGSLDTSFELGIPPIAQVGAIVIQPDGKIVTNGGFDLAGGPSSLARFNSDGSVDASFQSVPGIGSRIYRLANGSFLASGPNGLVRLTSSGALDSTFETQVAADSIYSIAVQSDGAIVIGGQFTSVNGQPRSRIARFDAQGVLDAGFVVPVDGRVTKVLVQNDDKLLIAGYFGQVDGYPRRGIARLKANGRLDIDAFVVTPLAGANGTITPNTPQQVNPGEHTQFTIVPDPGYVIGAVSGCGGSLDGLTYTTGAVVAHCTVTVDFLLDSVSHTVTPAAGPHGQLTPGAAQLVPFAQTTSFTVTPDAGYYLADIEGCGGSLEGTAYTTARILADCAVIARFHQPAALAASSGTPQSTAINTGFAAPLVVRVTDTAGLPVVGVVVDFTALGSTASAVLSAASATTNANGEASITARANGSEGSYVVTASVAGHTASFALSNEARDRSGLDFKVTVSTEPPPACGTASEIQAVPGEALNYCFTVTNRSDVTLNYHTLTMISFGFPYQYEPYAWDRWFDRLEYALPPGGTYRYNRMVTVGTQDQAPLFTWNATATVPDYEADADADVPFTDISAFGVALPLTIADRYQLESLPFPITYYGQVFLEGDLSTLCINNSGTLYLRRPLSDEIECPTTHITTPPLLGDNSHIAAFAGAFYPNGLAVYWDFLGDRGTVYYATVGEAPHRRLIVQWDGKDHALYPNPAQGIRFQAVFEEGTGKIHYVYDHLVFDVLAEPNPDRGGSATVGLFGFTDRPDPLYRQHSFNNPVLQDSQAITWTPTDVLHYATADVAVNVGTPHLTLAPGTIEASADAGTQIRQLLAIGNSGELDLAWSLREAAPRTHFPPLGLPGPLRLPDSKQLDGFGGAIAPSPAPAAPSAVFAVPAYASSGRLGPLSFDASNPTQFVHSVGVPGGQLGAADFAGPDFNHVYLLKYGGAPAGVSEDFAFAKANTNTFATTYIGEAAPIDWDQAPYQRWSGLSWDGTTDTMFASTSSISDNGTPCASMVGSELYTIDLGTAAATRIGVIEADVDLCISGLAVAPDGALYGIDSHNNALVAIDKHTGQAAIIGSLGVNVDTSISADFDDASNTLYLETPRFAGSIVMDNVIYTVDVVTGSAALVAPLPLVDDPIQSSVVEINGFSIAVAGGLCADPAQLPWLSLNQTAGVTPPGTQAAIDVTLNASGLTPGFYEANLCVFSNDRSQSLVRVPVGLTVTDGDRLFANGFDSASP